MFRSYFPKRISENRVVNNHARVVPKAMKHFAINCERLVPDVFATFDVAFTFISR